MWECGKWSPARNRWTKFFISVPLEMYREQYGKYVLVRNISSSQWLWYIYYDLSSEILVLIRNNIRKLFFLERPSQNDNHIREKITRIWSAENEFALTWVQSTISARTLSKFRLSGVSEMFFCTLLTSGNLISLAIWCTSFKDYKLLLLYWHMQVWCLWKIYSCLSRQIAREIMLLHIHIFILQVCIPSTIANSKCCQFI